MGVVREKVAIAPQPLLLPSPIVIVGSFGDGGAANAMTAAWAGIVSSHPPCIGVSLREATLSYRNIEARKAFTVNVPSEEHAVLVDYLGMTSGRDVDKFEATGLTWEKSARVDAPIVSEFACSLECELAESIDVGSHRLFIGRIAGIVADRDVLAEHGIPDIEKVRPIVWGSYGNIGYFGIGKRIGSAFSPGNRAIRRTE